MPKIKAKYYLITSLLSPLLYLLVAVLLIVKNYERVLELLTIVALFFFALLFLYGFYISFSKKELGGERALLWLGIVINFISAILVSNLFVPLSPVF